jgi:hypothetical protein
MPERTFLSFSALKSRQSQVLQFLSAGFFTSLLYFYAAYASRYNLSNVDGISYLSIARQYAEGRGEIAINGYWSPLVSWLMAPFITAGVDPLFSFMLVNAISATVGTCAAMALVWRYTKGSYWPTFIVLVSTFSLYMAQAPTITPDSWVVTWTTFFAWTLIEVDRRLHPGTVRDRIIGGLAIGAMGAIGYFTKQYLIPVFVVTVIIWFAFRILSDRKEYTPADRKEAARRWLLAPLATVVGVLIVATPWVTALSVKYGELTLGSSFSVNISQKFDPESGEEIRDPLDIPAPPNAYAVAFGEDRGTEVAETGGFQSSAPLFERIKFYVVERFAVFPHYLNKIGSFAPFAFVLLFGLLAAMAFRWVNFRNHRDAVSVLILGLVYFAGYAGITQVQSSGGNSRYYWPLLTLSTIVFALILPVAWKALFAHANVLRRIAAAGLIALLPLAAFTQNFLGYPHLFSMIQGSAGVGYLVGDPVKPIPAKFSEELKRDGVIAPHSKLVGENYRMTLRIAFYINSQAYGRSNHYYDLYDPAFREVFTDLDLDYFVRFIPTGEDHPDVSEFGKIVASYDTRISCSDERGAPVEDCTVDFISINK